MWDKILFGFDAEEETANFGTRAMAVCNNAIFETNTLAVVMNESDHEKEDSSNVLSVKLIKHALLKSGVLLSVGQCIIVFDDLCTELKKHYSFNGFIDYFVSLQNTGLISVNQQNFLFIGLNSGDLYCVPFESNDQHVLLHTFSGKRNNKVFSSIYLTYDDGICDLFVVTASSELYRVKNLNLTKLEEACLSSDTDAVNGIVSSINVEKVFPVSSDFEINDLKYVITSLHFQRAGNTFLLLLTKFKDQLELLLWSPIHGVVNSQPFPSNYELKKIDSNIDGSILIGLTTHGSLIIICPYTLMPIMNWIKTEITDFAVMRDEDSTNLLVFTRYPKCQFQLFVLPGFQIKFELDVNYVSFLPSGQSSFDDLFYLEAYSKNGDEISSQVELNKVNVLHVKSVSESCPEYRLERILKRGKYNEAEEFAKLFNLNVEIVYKSRVQKLMTDLQPWTESTLSITELGEKLKELLQKIQDVEFIGNCALNIITSDFVLTKELLLYAEERVKLSINNQDSQFSSKLTDLLCQIRNMILCLGTFSIVSDKPLTAEKWLSFCKADLLHECQLKLKQGNVTEAVLIWTRHENRLRNKITKEQCIHFLRIVPPWITSVQLLDWLQIFLPVCLSLFPNILSDVIVWCNEKINLMQLRSETEWPECAIHFLKKILKIIRIESNFDESRLLRLNNLAYSSNYLEHILYKVKILSDISEIRNKFGITVSISEYIQDVGQDVVFAILDKVPSDILQEFIAEFLEKYMLQHNLNSDLVISEYIQYLVEGPFDWWYWGEAPWENQVAVLVKCILNLEEQMKCVLCILKHAPVPWSNTIKNICEESLSVKKSDYIAQIREQQQYVTCKLILKKYNLKHNKFTNDYIQRILLYIFASGQSTMLEDALQLTSIFDESLQIEVYNLYVKYLIEAGELEQALTFLDDDRLSLKTVKCCCESIILRVHSMSKCDVLSEVYTKYVDILDSVNGKLSRAMSKLQAKEETTTIISSHVAPQLKYIHYYQNNYNLRVSPWSLSSREQHVLILNVCLAQILKNLIARPNDIQKSCLKLTELARSLSLTQEEVCIRLIHVCVSQNNLSFVSFLIGYLLKLDEFTASVSKKAITLGMRLLFHYIFAAECQTNKLSLEAVYSLIATGLLHCAPSYLREAMEISNWCKLLVSNERKKIPSIGDTVDMFSCSGSNNNVIESTLIQLLTSYILYLDVHKLPALVSDVDEKLFCKVKSNSSLSSELLEVIQYISEQEQELIYFRVIVNLHWSLSCRLLPKQSNAEDNAVLIQTKKLSSRSVSHLLKKCIGLRPLDVQRGLALLNFFSVAEGSNWISEALKSYKYDIFRLNFVSELGMTYYIQNKCYDKLQEISKIRRQCMWGKKISEYGISYKDAFRDTEHDQKQLLVKLMSVPTMTVSILWKYCRDINFDYQECLKMYLKQITLSWEPEFIVVTKPLTGEIEIVVKPTDQKLLSQCREIVALITDAKELSEIIGIYIWDQVNYYHYEVFFVLIALLEEKGIKPEKTLFNTYRAVFMFLSTYQRISEPQQYEKETWFQLYPNTRSLPPISKYRLPFRLLFSTRSIKPGAEVWKIIQHELNRSTYTKWFTLLDALSLNKDMLCTLAVNQITMDESINRDFKMEWNIHLRHQKLLEDVKSCVANIKNLEMASASLYFVVNHLPPGADQLAAANLCYLHAKQWLEVEKSENAQTGFLKVQKKYLSVSTTHILYIHNLGMPEYLQLVLQPSELIHAIYHHPSILQRNTADTFTMPDINKAAEGIGNLHGIDVIQIKTELLEEWLQPVHFMRDLSLDENVNANNAADFLNNTLQSSKIDSENLQRACYVLESDISQFGPYFINIALSQNADDFKPIAVRLRALHCLYFIMTEEHLEELVGQNVEQIKAYMKNLMFISELEKIGLAYSLQGFMYCDKSDLVQSLLNKNNTSSVSLAFCVCEAFNINTPFIWNKMLNSMIKLLMVKQLMSALSSFANNYHLLDSKIFENAWETALTVPLTKACLPLTVEQEELIEKSVQLTYSCPIIDRIDLAAIKENCLRINRKDLADKIQFLLTPQ